MHSPRIETREVGWGVIVLLLATLAVALVVALAGLDFLSPITERTGEWIQPNLVAALAIALVTVGGVLFWIGGLRPRDVGLVRARIPAAAAGLLGFWLALQAIAAVAYAITGRALIVDPIWTGGRLALPLGFLLSAMLGTPLMEEVAIRGFLLPQLYLKLNGITRSRLWGAIVLSAIAFALLHLPRRYFLGLDTSPEVLAGVTGYFSAIGIGGALMYLRTANLPLVIGLHAIHNAPTPLIGIPRGADFLAIYWLLYAVVFVAWPVLDSGKWSWEFARIETRTSARELAGDVRAGGLSESPGSHRPALHAEGVAGRSATD